MKFYESHGRLVVLKITSIQMLFQESVEYPKCKTITDKYNHCDEYSYAGSGLKSAPEGNKNQRDNNAKQCKNSKCYAQCPPIHIV